MSELKPCPFCGDDSLVVFDNPEDELSHSIFCARCGGGKRWEMESTYRPIAEQWNTRPLEDALSAENAKLREDLNTSASQMVMDDEVVQTLQAENAKLRDALELKNEKIQEIVDWCNAYPLDIAPEPEKEDWKRANEILAANSISFSQLNISTMRHVVNGIAKIAEEALK